MQDGDIRNSYTLKIANRTFEPVTAQVAFSGVAGAQIKTPGADITEGPVALTVEPNQVRAVRVFVTAAPAALPQANMPATFTVQAAGATQAVTTTFLSGAANAR
mgnify:FL=1